MHDRRFASADFSVGFMNYFDEFGLPTVAILMLPIYFVRMPCRPKRVQKRLAPMAVLFYLTNRSERSGEAV